jgi:DNA-binding NtrC family response regulator
VGAERDTETDVRVVAATHRDLARLTAEGRFREDLYWRLAVVAVRLPPLRERPEDLPEIAAHLLRRLARRHALPCAQLTAAALDRLRVHAWPGNVRELEAVLARALLAHGGGELPAAALVLAATLPEGAVRADARLEEEMIRDALRRGGGAVEAARLIGWSRQKLYRRMSALGVRPRDRHALNPRAESRAAATERDPR